MKCGVCGGESRVVDSRETKGWIRRRRECERCGARWTTFEMPGEEMETVRKIRRLIEQIGGGER